MRTRRFHRADLGVSYFDVFLILTKILDLLNLVHVPEGTKVRVAHIFFLSIFFFYMPKI